ncbi:hypothetical protein E8E14_006168 [Neopestalotiopsis sp. 37M]|nr:hypothetical protein E8E14_006168 [Neopestalotiopsis sp. 37M]
MAPPSQNSKLPWGMGLLTAFCIILAFVFHSRWERPVSQWPINLPLRPYTFVDHPHLRDFDNADASEYWGAMVWHEWWNAEWRDDAGRRFPRGIDVFHKIHCIVAIREEFANLAMDDVRPSKRELASETQPASRDKRVVDLTLNQSHLEHCFDFLRQDILCAADMTLEPLAEGYVETDGQGVEHQCKDWRVLLDLMKLPDMDEI